MLNSDAEAVAKASSKYGPLIIQDKLRQLAAYERAALLQFPRTERHSICQDIRMTTRNIQRLISRCKKRYYKKTTLEDIDVELDLLRELISESYESRYINVHKYEVWSRKINEIGKMVGGWVKALKSSRCS